MPGELDPINSGDTVRHKYDKLISDSTTEIVKAPLTPQAKKTGTVKNQTLGGKDGVQTRAQYVTREAINAYSRSNANRMPSASLFSELVSSAYHYIKTAFKRTPSMPKPELTVSLPYNVKHLDAEDHLKAAKKQLASLKHNLAHPGEKKLKLDPNYPKDLIGIKNLINELDGKLNEIKETKKQALEAKIQALADFGEAEAYQYDQGNAHEARSFNQLSDLLANELVTHQGIEDLNNSIKHLEKTLAFAKHRYATHIKTIKDHNIIVPPKTQERLANKLKTLSEPIEKEIAEKKLELSKLEANRSTLTKGMLKDAESLQKIATEWIAEENSTDHFKLSIQNLYDEIASSEQALNNPTSEANARELESHIQTNKKILAELKSTRENDLEQFKNAIDEQEKMLAEVELELKNRAEALPENWLAEGNMELLHDEISQASDLILSKEDLKHHIANNKANLLDIEDELRILNLEPKTLKIGVLRDLLEETPISSSEREDYRFSTTENEILIRDLERQIAALDEKIASHTILKEAAMAEYDLDKATELDLKKDEYLEEKAKLTEQLNAINPSKVDFTLEANSLKEIIDLQYQELNKLNQKMTDLSAEVKNSTSSQTFGQNALKMKEYRTQKNELLSEIKQNEEHLSQLMDGENYVKFYAEQRKNLEGEIKSFTLAIKKDEFELNQINNQLKDIEDAETGVEAEVDRLQLEEDLLSRKAELGDFISQNKNTLLEIQGELESLTLLRAPKQGSLKNLGQVEVEKSKPKAPISDISITKEQDLRKQDELLSETAYNFILEKKFKEAFESIIQINDVEMRKYYTIELMNNTLDVDKDLVHKRMRFNLLDVAMRLGASFAASMPDEDLKEKYLAQIGKHFLDAGNVPEAESIVADMKDGAIKTNILNQIKQQKTAQ